MPKEDSMLNMMLGVVLAFAGIQVLAPTFQRIFAATPMAQSYAAQVYSGLTDSRVLEADEKLKWINLADFPPFTPWIAASFFNDGPDSAYIAINNPDEMLELKKGENQYVNLSFAERRIEVIFYKTAPGKKAGVRVEGKY